MISVLPQSSETLVVAMDGTEVRNRLLKATAPKAATRSEIIRNPATVFTGYVMEDRFRLSLKITRPNSFLPLIVGTIDPTSTGCLLFLNYKLFPSTRMYLTFWVLFSVLFGIFLTYHYKNIFTGLLFVFITAAILFISWANFKIQLKFTRQALQKVLN